MSVSQDLPPIPPVQEPPRRSKRSTWIWIVVGLAVLCLCCAVLAVGIYLLRDQVPAIGNLFATATPTATPTPTSTPTPLPTPTPRPTPTSPPFVAGDCDPGAEQIEMNTSVDGHINSGSSFYDVIAMYCLWVPDGGTRLEIDLTDFSVDLDIYISISYEELMSPTGMGEWNSRALGTAAEHVTIPNPGGRYYIQVVSYDGSASDFTLSNTYTP